MSFNVWFKDGFVLVSMVFLFIFGGAGVCVAASIDIQANNSDGPIAISANEALTVSISQVLDEEKEQYGDYWLLAVTPEGVYYYNLFKGWLPGLEVTYQGLLLSFPMFPVFNISGLSDWGMPPGRYTFLFGTDKKADAQISIESLMYDGVEVNIGTTEADVAVSNILCKNGKLTVVASNLGTRAINFDASGGLNVWIDGQLERSCFWLCQDFGEPGRLCNMQLQMLDGNHTVKACIDPSNVLVESDESNNCMEVHCTCGGDEARALVVFDHDHLANGLLLNTGGDVDTEVVSAGSPSEQVLRSGNGEVLSAADGNRVEDHYIQFNVDDAFIYRSLPTPRVQIEVEYLDEGTNTFSIQYDAINDGSGGDCRFKDTGVVVKTDSGEFKTAVFPLCDAYFANRTNGGDFRITDRDDGAESIRRVIVSLGTSASGSAVINVDSCGANPFDDQPDSDAIQACIDQACSGDTVLFTSPVGSSGYQGYIIDKTIFLVRTSAKSDLIFSSTDPNRHALLKASPGLLGFVVRLFARSSIGGIGNIDNITISHLDLDGNRAERKCYGADEIGNGIDDNWGSWLPECNIYGDPWCSPGTLAMDGHCDHTDPKQNYLANPDRWTTGLVVQDVALANTECGTALAFHGAAGVIDSVVIDTAGDHVHVPGCVPTDPDESLGAWSDGITFSGPANLITNNLIMDPSDIGIVSFGGRDTIISNNTIIARFGNNGMFAGIAVHPWIYGLISGFQIVGNQIINEASTTCGGIHVGINVGAHMWGAGCINNPSPTTVGNTNECLSFSQPPGGMLCVPGHPCRVWGYIPEGATFTLADNVVTGAQVNFLVEGLDVLGALVVYGNVSNSPQLTDWFGDQNCTWNGIIDSWGAINFVAHDPTIEGWTDQRIYCER
ncbi:MAG: hypothetical protein J7L35_02670 [Anaerolineales bacterium]|nr:hypothetical protein [Anaerolineales bacterium]